MTAQDYIERIGRSLVEIEERLGDLKQATRRLNRAVAEHHELLNEAQAAYSAANPSDNVVAFSGGHDKPPPDTDPDEPIPPPGG